MRYHVGLSISSRVGRAVSRKLLGHLAAFLTILAWGMTFISTKILLESFTPIEVLLMRFAIGYVALSIAFPRPLAPQGLRRELVLASAGLTGVCLYYLLENTALTYTLASNASVIVSTAPFFTALLATLLSHGQRRLHLDFFAGFALSMIGIALISFAGSPIEVNPLGDLMALGGAFVWAFYSAAVDKAGEWGVSNLGTTRRIFAYGIAFMIPAALWMGFSPDPRLILNPLNIGNLAFLGVIACAACFASWNFAIRQLGPVTSGTYIYLTPVITVLAAALILHEQLTLWAIAGVVLTLAGLVVSQRRAWHGNAS